MKVLKELLHKLNNKPDSQKQEHQIPEHYPFTQWYTYGMHKYKTADEDPTVEFIDRETGHRKTIVNANGKIVGFPGIEKGDWIDDLESEDCLSPIIRFRTGFERCGEDKYLMIWEAQPDGRYWEDEDGFGGTSDLEVRLYTFLDKKGNFTGPFRIYNVGNEKYFQAE